MNFVESAHYVSFVNTPNFSKYDLEKRELESFCHVIPLEKEDALSSLRNLKVFLNTEDFLSFEKLDGGNSNAPILIYKHTDFHKISVGVLKHEPNGSWAEKRMKALDEMRGDGFWQLPCILKDKNDNYLVKLGAAFFTCIEYLASDPHQPSSIEQMFMLASIFHNYSTRNSFKEELKFRALDYHSNENTSHLVPELLKWNPTIFTTDTWDICVKSALYFTSQSFLDIYNTLPTQFIHGDITPDNIVTSNGKSFFIDFDKIRTDVRLLEFATFLGWSFLERYLILTEEDKLFSCIQTSYGELEEVENKYFHLIVLLGRCGVVEWCLREIKQALQEQDLQKEQQFGAILKGTINEINEIHKRIPQIKEFIIK